MAMIRGRVRRDDASQQKAEQIIKSSFKLKPQKGLKEQRRMMADFNDNKKPNNVPIDDPDPYYEGKETFLVLNKNNLIFRFSEKKSVFMFGRKSKIRIAFIRLLIHPLFNALVIGTILINMLVMMVNGNEKPVWSELYVENIFTFIYTVEAVTKIVGRGFILHTFSYLRDPWNWLDFVVIVAAYVLIIIDHLEIDSGSLSSLTFLRVIRVLRVFKTVSVIPGLRMIVSALIASTKALKDAVLLSLLGFSMFSLVGIQLFRGVLKNKCVLNPPWEIPITSKNIPPECMHNFTTSNSTSIFSNISQQITNSCSIVQIYSKEIKELFGEKSLQEMIYLENPLQYHKLYPNSLQSRNISDTIYTITRNFSSMFFNVTTSSWMANNFSSAFYKSTTEIPTSTISLLNRTTISSYMNPNLSANFTSLTNNTFNVSDWDYKINIQELFTPVNFTFNWLKWISDKNHYVMNGYVPKLCGNSSTALKCPIVSTCLKIGENPNFGYTSFDNFLYAFLSVFRLSLQDNWEEMYLQILETSGTPSMLFFLILILLGSYYLVNLILAVVATAYEDQRKSVETTLEEERERKIKEAAMKKMRRNALTGDIIPTKSRRKSFIKKTCGCWVVFKDIFLLWSCCVGSSFLCKIRERLKKKLEHSNAELFTVSLVLLNTVLMAMEHEPKTETFNQFLEVSNLIFTSLFTIEVILKMFAFNPLNYFIVTWNVFDFIVVTLSLIEVFLSDVLPDGLGALRTFRLIRLVRILKLARAWPTLSKLMKMIADSLSKLGYLTLVLLIVLVIFAMAGMQTVGTSFYMDNKRGIPLRWHMNDFAHAFLVVFRIQCGEWIQSMWSCMHSVSVNGSESQVPVCIFIFLGVVFVGNLVVLNLFLALLLNSFSSEALNSGSGSGGSHKAKKFLSSLKKAGKALPKTKLVKRISGNKSRIKPQSSASLSSGSGPENDASSNGKVKRKSKTSSSASANVFNGNGRTNIGNGDDCVLPVFDEVENHTKVNASEKEKCIDYLTAPKHLSELMYAEKLGHDIDFTYKEIGTNLPGERVVYKSQSTESSSSNSGSGSPVSADDEREDSTPTSKTSEKNGHLTNKSSALKTPQTCWQKTQLAMYRTVTHWVFETIIIFMIMLSSCALIFEDVHLHKKPTLALVLGILDKIFTGVFVLEMLMKWVGFGLKKYFTDGWCILDSFIVLISIVSLSMEIHASLTASSNADLSQLRVLRSLRAFRPLRAMSRFKGIKVVTDALFRSIPAILNVLVICLVFWLVFAIMGINLFAGKMAACRYKETGEKVWHPQDFQRYKGLLNYYERPPIDVVDKESCIKLANLTGGKVHWKNLYVNFDNVGISYISLMQIATFKGWMPIMYAAVDSPSKIGEQPIQDKSIWNYFFFVAFIIFGAFFTLNLFISVVIDNFNQQKKKFEFKGGELFLTETQRKAYNVMKNLTARTPRKLFTAPKGYWRQRLHLFVTGDVFELTVMVVTLLNLVVMALEYEGIPKTVSVALEYTNYGFVGIFTLEITLRLIASGIGYFQIPWNVFDFLVITASLITNLISVLNNKGSSGGDTVTASPWLPLLRMIRIARILRVARVASGIRTLLFALMLSLPALFNVGSLLFLVMFIYSIFGMGQFSSIEHKGAVTEILNFETFPNAFMLLFQASTSAGWDGFMEPMLYTDGENSDCGSIKHGKSSCMGTTFIGYFYFVSYLILTFVIITNMYIAIILENFDLATKDSAEPLTADDFEHYFDEWQRYDHDGKGKLTVRELSDFLHSIDKPLKVKKPNMKQIAEMEIPMDENENLHIFDVATALIKRIMGPTVFTDDIKREVENHFRRKSKRLMRNYSRASLYKTTISLMAAIESNKTNTVYNSIWKKITSNKSDTKIHSNNSNIQGSSEESESGSIEKIILPSSRKDSRTAIVHKKSPLLTRMKNAIMDKHGLNGNGVNKNNSNSLKTPKIGWEIAHINEFENIRKVNHRKQLKSTFNFLSPNANSGNNIFFLRCQEHNANYFDNQNQTNLNSTYFNMHGSCSKDKLLPK